jgi:hypothetical protein
MAATRTCRATWSIAITTAPSTRRRASISNISSRRYRPASGRAVRSPSLVETIGLERYNGWANYERLRRMNVEAAYFNLTGR